MYKVFIESVAVYQSPSIEEAVGFALSLHRSSNLPHKVGVIEIGNLKTTIVFERPSERPSLKSEEDGISS